VILHYINSGLTLSFTI